MNNLYVKFGKLRLLGLYFLKPEKGVVFQFANFKTRILAFFFNFSQKNYEQIFSSISLKITGGTEILKRIAANFGETKIFSHFF